MPERDWFSRMMERVGRSRGFVFVKIAGTKLVLHWVRRVGKPWTQDVQPMLHDLHDNGSIEIVTIEAGGILVGASAEEVTAHIELTWKLGDCCQHVAGEPGSGG
jgi:hypothetical protein